MRRLIPLAVLAWACTDDETPGTTVPGGLPGLPVLGDASHDPSRVSVEVALTADDGLSLPRDLEFSPATGDLWVVSRRTDAVTILFEDGSEPRTIVDAYALHFMEEVSSLAFGAALFVESDLPNFGTCQESRNTYNGQAQPNDFMGPALWTSDLEYFGETNPDAVEELGADLGSHLDMLHESPNCMGIAWDTDNVYWVFDGKNSSIVRYDFQADHGRGFDDHSDGLIGRYLDGDVKRLANVPSHMVLDHETGLLYFADTGNNRIAVLDTTTGERGRDLPAIERGTEHYSVKGADSWTLVEGADVGLEAPSGLELVDGTLLVTDNATSTVHAFSLDGAQLDFLQLDVREGGLMGIAARALDDLWLVDAKGDEVLHLTPN